MISRLIRSFALPVLFLLPVLAQCQLFEFKENLKWGLFDASSEIVVPASYDRIEASPSYTYFYLYEGEKMGVYHHADGLIIKPEYDRIFPIEDNFFIVADKGKYGIIDGSGKVIAEPTYEKLQQADAYFYTVKDGKLGLFDPGGSGEILTAKYDSIYRYDSTHFAIIENGSMGLADKLGTIIESPEYDAIEPFHEELYKFKRGGLIGLKPVGASVFSIPLEYDRISPFEHKEPLLQASANGWSTLYKLTGEKVGESFQGYFTEYFDDFYVYKKGQGVGLMDKDMRPLTEPIFSRMKPTKGDRIMVARGKNYGLINREGKLILPSSFARIHVDDNDLIWAKQRNLWALYQADGKQLFPPTFLKPAIFENDMAVVSVPYADGGARATRQGVINSKGTFVFPTEYEGIKIYSEKVFLKQANADSILSVDLDKAGKLTNSQRMISMTTWKEEERKANEDSELANIDWNWKEQTARSMEVEPTTEYSWAKAYDLWGLKYKGEETDKWKIPPTYHTIIQTANDDLAVVGIRDDEQNRWDYGLVSVSSAQPIIPIVFKKIFEKDLETSNYIRVVSQDGLFNIMTSKGLSTIASGAKFRTFWNRYASYGIKQAPTYIGTISNGRARVCFNGKILSADELTGNRREELLLQGGGRWGIMGLNGTFDMDPVYDYLGETVEGASRFSYKKKWGILDTNYQVVLDAQYEYLGGSPSLLISRTGGEKLSILQKDGKLMTSMLGDDRNDAYKDGKVEEYGEWSEGLIAFKKKGKWGFMNEEGAVKIEPTYAKVGKFTEGLAKVKQGRYWGFMDKEGNMVIEPEYLRAEQFQHGMAAVGDGRVWNFITPAGKKGMKHTFNAVETFVNGKTIVKEDKSNLWGLVDTSGNWLIEPEYDEVKNFGGYYRVRQKQKYGYFNAALEEIIPAEHTFLGEISEGKVAIRTSRLYGYADETGETKIQPTFDMAEAFSDGMAAVKKGNRWGFIDDTGNLVVPALYHSVKPFKGGIATVGVGQNGNARALKWGAVDKEGKEIVPIAYEEIQTSTGGILMCKDAQGHWYAFDQYGIQLSEGNIHEVSEAEHGLMRVKQAHNTVLIDANGKTVTHPGYDEIPSWETTYILGRNIHRSGLIDRSGSQVLPMEYDAIHYYNGLFQVVNDGKVGYVDAKGSWVWELKE